ncbi:MAG TPA: hypothetical protein V6D12_21815 [Candidatus Obscuribacterales bacterium]
MSPLKKLPTSLKYFKARLRTLARPGVLVPAVMLCLLLVGVWEYWTHPEWLSASGSNQDTTNNGAGESTLSQQDSAAIADIDSSPVLQQTLDTPLFTLPTALPNQKTQVPKPESLYEQITRQQATAGTQSTPLAGSDTPKDKAYGSNPFYTPAPTFFNPGSLTNGNTFLGGNPISRPSPSSTTGAITSPVIGSSWLDTVNSNSSAATISPLQAALNQLSIANSLPSSATTQTPPSTLNQSLPNPVNQGQSIIPPSTQPSVNGYSLPQQTPPSTAYPNPYPSNPYTYLNQPQQLPSVAPVAPMTQVAPGNANTFNQPSLPANTFGQSALQNPNQTTGLNNPGFNSPQATPGWQPSQLNQSQLNQPQSNLSSPPPTPGSFLNTNPPNYLSNP